MMYLRRAAILFLIFAIGFIGCSDDSEPFQACKTDNVLVDLPWLAELIEEQEQSSIGQNFSFISKGRYKMKTVFILQNCCPNCSTVSPVYDCNGEKLGFLGANDIEFDKVQKYEVIWKSSENSCVFPE